MLIFTFWFAAVIPFDAAMLQSVDFERGKCEYAVLSSCSELLSICCATALRDHAGYTATHYAALNGHRLTLEMVFTI